MMPLIIRFKQWHAENRGCFFDDFLLCVTKEDIDFLNLYVRSDEWLRRALLDSAPRDNSDTCVPETQMTQNSLS